MSIKERIAMLQGSSGKSSNDLGSTPQGQKPLGDLMIHGWLGRAGAGIMSSTYNKRAQTQQPGPSKATHITLHAYASQLTLIVAARPYQCGAGYVVIHVAPEGPLLSLYESMTMDTLKGGRMKLEGATLTHKEGEDKFQVHAQGAMAKGPVKPAPVITKFKAGSAKEAADWVSHIQNAISGKRGTAPALPHAGGELSQSSQLQSLPTAPAPAAPPRVKAAKSKSRGNFFSSILPTARSPTTPRSANTTGEAEAPAADTLDSSVSPEAVSQLMGLAARLGVAGGLAHTPSEALGCKPTPSGSSTPQEVAAQLEMLVEYVEKCATGVGLKRLGHLTERLERRVSIPAAARAASPPLPPGTATPTNAQLGQLEGLIARMEAAAKV
jgi:hypothetical protein